MNFAEQWALIAGMMGVTFGVRYGVLAFSGRKSLPKRLEAALEFVPVAVLTALCVPLMVKPGGIWSLSLDNSHLLAGVVAVVIAATTRHLLLTIVAGMLLFLALHLQWF